MAKTSPDLIPGAGTGQLAHGTLRLWDAIAISVSVVAVALTKLLNVTGVAAVAGGSTPLAFLLGGIGCLALAFVVIGFCRRMATAGYAYTYASRSLGKEMGFMAGWLYFFGFICFVPMTMSGVGFLAADLLGLNPKLWILFFFIGMVLFLVLSTIHIKVTTRVQLIVGIVTVAVIVLVDVVTTAKGGSHGQALSAFSFNHTNEGGFTGVFYGIILGVTSYIGFETAADFGEETAKPRRNIPIAIIAATGFAVVLYLFTTYAIAIGFGVNNGAKFGADPVALKTTATTFVGPWLGTLVEIGGMAAAFIVCVACATAAARTLFAMGREGVLPKAFARTHPRFKTPVNATIAVTVVATLMALLMGYPLSDPTFGQPWARWSSSSCTSCSASGASSSSGGPVTRGSGTRSGTWCSRPLARWSSGRRGTGRCIRPRRASSSGPRLWRSAGWSSVSPCCSGCARGGPTRWRRSARSSVRRAVRTPRSSTGDPRRFVTGSPGRLWSLAPTATFLWSRWRNWPQTGRPGGSLRPSPGRPSGARPATAGRGGPACPG